MAKSTRKPTDDSNITPLPVRDKTPHNDLPRFDITNIASVQAWYKVLRRRSGWPVAVGTIVKGVYLKKRKSKLNNLTDGLDGLCPKAMGDGFGRLVAHWLMAADPQKRRRHAVVVDRSYLAKTLKRMDTIAETPMEIAAGRFLASKVMLQVEGFRAVDPDSRHAGYQVFQHQAREILRVLPHHHTLSTADVFLGKPFNSEMLLITAHRFLNELIDVVSEASDNDKLAKHFRSFIRIARLQHAEDDDLIGEGAHGSADMPYAPSKRKDLAEHYARLFAITYKQKDYGQLSEDLDDWMDDVSRHLQKSIRRDERMINTSIAVFNGEIPFAIGSNLLNKVFSKA